MSRSGAFSLGSLKFLFVCGACRPAKHKDFMQPARGRGCLIVCPDFVLVGRSFMTPPLPLISGTEIAFLAAALVRAAKSRGRRH